MPGLIGYADKLSVQPGRSIKFMVSAEDHGAYSAGLVRLISGDANPDGPGFKQASVDSAIDGEYPGRKQEIHAGSYIVVPHDAALENLGSFCLAAMIWPTTPGKVLQGLITKWCDDTRAGFGLVIDEHASVALMLGDGEGRVEVHGAGKPLGVRRWYFVAASYNAVSGRVRVDQRPLVEYPFSDDAASVETVANISVGGCPDVPLIVAAHGLGSGSPSPEIGGHYNGKIDGPRLYGRALTEQEIDVLAGDFSGHPFAKDQVAAWDFSRDISSTTIHDNSSNQMHGEAINLPARAMTGHNWTGEVMDWRQAPEQYGAIHFHDDDLYDAGWEADFELVVPDKLMSGVYAVHLRAGSHEDYIPFFVRPPKGTATAKAAFLVPTATYLAYANDHGTVDGRNAQLLAGRLVELTPENLVLNDRPEYGNSLYDAHLDGSGTCYSSRLRPILNMRPKFTWWCGGIGSELWAFNSDTHITDWLEAIGHDYDVITDEDLHSEGVALLAPYRVILTGTHPEYYSTAMWDAMRDYLHGGGRMMYLGGNGFYWRIAFHEKLPGVIEVRRNENGIRAWAAAPGEYYQSFDGEYGGLWRNLGRPPQVLCGTGFVAQGFDVSSCFRRLPDSFDPRARFIFEGIGDDESIGDFGLLGGGAAGLELDAVDPALGTPPHTLVVASSENHTDTYLLVPEELLQSMPNNSGTQNDRIRADMTFFETSNGGGVFSTGSIAWCGSLAHNDYDNNVSRITGNVLKRFLSDEPL